MYYAARPFEYWNHKALSRKVKSGKGSTRDIAQLAKAEAGANTQYWDGKRWSLGTTATPLLYRSKRRLEAILDRKYRLNHEIRIYSLADRMH
jgi:hypothetical protein